MRRNVSVRRRYGGGEAETWQEGREQRGSKSAWVFRHGSFTLHLPRSSQTTKGRINPTYLSDIGKLSLRLRRKSLKLGNQERTVLHEQHK